MVAIKDFEMPSNCSACMICREDGGACDLLDICRTSPVERPKDCPLVEIKEQTGHCKDCKYFEYDSVAKCDGTLLIVAHEICSKWGGGCKTREDGYCFLFEPQDSEDKEDEL